MRFDRQNYDSNFNSRNDTGSMTMVHGSNHNIIREEKGMDPCEENDVRHHHHNGNNYNYYYTSSAKSSGMRNRINHAAKKDPPSSAACSSSSIECGAGRGCSKYSQ